MSDTDYVTVQDASRQTGVKLPTLRRWIRDKVIPAWKQPASKRVFVRIADIRNALELKPWEPGDGDGDQDEESDEDERLPAYAAE